MTIPRDRWDDVRIRLARAEAEAAERALALADARLALRALTAGPATTTAQRTRARRHAQRDPVSAPATSRPVTPDVPPGRGTDDGAPTSPRRRPRVLPPLAPARSPEVTPRRTGPAWPRSAGFRAGGRRRRPEPRGPNRAGTSRQGPRRSRSAGGGSRAERSTHSPAWPRSRHWDTGRVGVGHVPWTWVIDTPGTEMRPGPSPRCGTRSRPGCPLGDGALHQDLEDLPEVNPAASTAWGSREVSVHPGGDVDLEERHQPVVATIRSARDRWRSPRRSCAATAVRAHGSPPRH